MKKLLLIGAGKSATVLIKYLLANQSWITTVADTNFELAESKVGKAFNGNVVQLDIFNVDKTEELIKDKDIVISLLPANLHHLIAAICINNRVPLITASYVSSEIVNLSKSAELAGVPIIMEMGLDPGLDHMSAKKEIDEIEANGGVVVGFKSFCGGLPAPESIDNPWRYKFSWNPRNVVLAGQGTAKYLDKGMVKYIPYHKLFERTERIEVDGCLYEGYYNRDSLSYLNSYTKEIPHTFIRGTLRFPTFCEGWNALIQLGMTDDSYTINCKGMTHKDFLTLFLKRDYHKLFLADYLNVPVTGHVLQKIQNIDLLSDEPLSLESGTPAQILQSILEKKWVMKDTDKDMIVMKHEFQYKCKGEDTIRKSESSLVCIGDNSIDTAMAKTVGLPLGITAKLILDGSLILRGGVHIPTAKELYEPILNELVNYGIVFKISQCF